MAVNLISAGAGAQPKERYRVLLFDAVSSQHAMLATKLNDRVTSGRVHVGEFGFCVAFVLFNSDNHDVDVDDGDGERFPPIQDLRVPTTVTKGLCNGREQEREAEKLLEEREKVGLVTVIKLGPI
jgi:hypothetical protein